MMHVYTHSYTCALQHTQQQTDTIHYACNILMVMLCLIILACKTYIASYKGSSCLWMLDCWKT